jgi:glycine/D-amino acid oxidase-like deaminating enzyme
MAFTPDYLPIADQVPDNPNVWVVGGFCGQGMPFAMRLSQLLTKAIVCNAAPEELKPFRLDRATLKWATNKK